MFKYILIVVGLLLLAGCAKKNAADAYICGEPPDEVTFYCKVGTGPPRQDCSAPQTGTFDVDPITC
jgi:hypothetical protein